MRRVVKTKVKRDVPSVFDWKSVLIGGSVVLLTSIASISGVRASRYAIDCNQADAMNLIDRQLNQQLAMQDSIRESKRYSGSDGSGLKPDVVSENNASGVSTDENGSVMDSSVPTDDSLSEGQPDSVSDEATPAKTESGWHEAYPEIQRDDSGRLFYLICPGDTLLGISEKFGFGVTELAQYNQISNPSRIYTGGIILFPDEGPSFIGDPSVGLG